MPEKAPIGMRVLQKRLKDEKKQLEFATELSVCEKTIRNLEQSNANPSLKTLKHIAANMQKSVSSFLNLSQSLEADLYDNYVGGDLQDISAEIATLSLRLQIFLRFSGETQQSFSEHSGVCLDTVNRLIRKLPSCNPTLSTLQSFAAYMSVTVSELLDTTLSETDMEKLLAERLGAILPAASRWR